MTPTNFKTVICNSIENKTINVENNTNLFLFDIDDKNTDVNIKFNILKNIKLQLFVFVVCDKNKHKFNLNFHLSSNAQLDMESKLFANNDAKIYLNGTIVVDKHIKNVVANQKINGFLFSNLCEINTTPILAINNNQVNVNHAVKITKIDHQKMFYLQSKGYDQKQAIQILLDSELNSLEFINDKKVNYKAKIKAKIKEMI